MVSGYFFWLVMSKITTPDIIGASSTLISAITIFVSIVTLGIPNGVQRFLGKSFSENQTSMTNLFIQISLILTSLSISAVALIIFIFRDAILDRFGINPNLAVVAILLLGSTVIATLFRSIIIASLRTRILSMVMIASSTAKLVLAAILVMLGTGVAGLTIGYSLNQIVASIVLGIVIVVTLRSSKSRIKLDQWKLAAKEILAASTVAWIPSIISTMGLQLGTILVFGSLGASQAGVYFIAFSIVTAITGVMYSLFTISYPVLSGMSDGRKRFAWRTIKFSLLISLPLSSAFMFYSKDILELLGREYVQGTESLEILLISILPVAVFTGINSLVYAYGNYRQVLAIGLASSIPRTILYFVFVPAYGSEGAAIAFTIGSVIGFAVSVLITRQIRMQIPWREVIFIFLVPSGIAFILSYIQINYVAGITVTLLLSYLSLLKLKIIAIEDVRDPINILPSKLAIPILRMLTEINKKINS